MRYNYCEHGKVNCERFWNNMGAHFCCEGMPPKKISEQTRLISNYEQCPWPSKQVKPDGRHRRAWNRFCQLNTMGSKGNMPAICLLEHNFKQAIMDAGFLPQKGEKNDNSTESVDG